MKRAEITIFLCQIWCKNQAYVKFGVKTKHLLVSQITALLGWFFGIYNSYISAFGQSL